LLGCATTNQIPHVTVAVSPSGKAVDSNFITEWKPVAVPFELTGVLEHYSKLKLGDGGGRGGNRGGRGGRGGKHVGGHSEKKIALAPIITKYHPQIKGKAIGDAGT